MTKCFNTQPPEGGCWWSRDSLSRRAAFQHTAARRRLESYTQRYSDSARFNTQPPEGGWSAAGVLLFGLSSFNTQPPEGGCRIFTQGRGKSRVSTHSRPKAADHQKNGKKWNITVSTHSRPKAADRPTHKKEAPMAVSTHSRPKAAVIPWGDFDGNGTVSTHSRPKAAAAINLHYSQYSEFQHTAARRRLLRVSQMRYPM